MNYKSIALAFIATIVFVSCKKETEVKNEIEVKKEFQGRENVTEQKQVMPTVKNIDGKYAKMEFATLEHDFGTINQEKPVETIFTFTNTGDADLLISKAVGSCGCTIPEYPKEPIAPGQKADIKVSFNPKGKNGMQSKTVTLTTNTMSGTEKLTIKASIKQ